MPFRRLRLRVETTRHVVEGVLQLPTEGYRSRTTDYLNAHDTDFVALTDATVRPLDGGEVEERPYVAVHLRHVVLVVELDDLGVTEQPVGPLVASLPHSQPPPAGTAA